jgi:hypothetical protein
MNLVGTGTALWAEWCGVVQRQEIALLKKTVLTGSGTHPASFKWIPGITSPEGA